MSRSVSQFSFIWRFRAVPPLGTPVTVAMEVNLIFIIWTWSIRMCMCMEKFSIQRWQPTTIYRWEFFTTATCDFIYLRSPCTRSILVHTKRSSIFLLSLGTRSGYGMCWNDYLGIYADSIVLSWWTWQIAFDDQDKARATRWEWRKPKWQKGEKWCLSSASLVGRCACSFSTK